MEEKKKKNKVVVVDKAIERFADAVVEHMHIRGLDELDPFERYAWTLRAKIHLEMPDFRRRFTHGYEVLLKELA